MKRKYLDRMDWPRILRREDTSAYFSDADFSGHVHRLHMLEVTGPLSMNKSDGASGVIVDVGYTWLMLMPDGRPYVLTGQFDASGRLLYIYVDVIDAYGEEAGHIWFDDIYIDIFLCADGKVFFDDIDELRDAYASGELSQRQYDAACRHALELYDDMQGDPQYFLDLMETYFRKIRLV